MAKKYNRVSGSILGKTATIIAREDKIDIYTTSTLLIILSLWIFAGAFFVLSLPLDNTIISMILTTIGAVIGFLLASKLYIGKLKDSFSYKDITCFMYSAPDFTIVKSDNYMYVIRILKKSYPKIIRNINEVLENSNEYVFIKKNGKYYVEEKNI